MIPKGSMRRLNTTWPLLLTILSALLSASAVTDTLSPGDKMGDDGYLVSADGSFKLGFFTPGESKFRYLGIWYNTMPQQTVIWVANRDSPLPDSTGILSILGNGTLLLSDAKGEVYWTTLPTDLANPVAKLLNNSNFVVIGAGGAASGASYAWQSFDYPTDSLLPGMKLGWDLVAGRNRTITAWRSEDDPASGEYAVGFYAHDDPQIFLVRGKTRVWRSGRWIGQHFSGIPELKDSGWYRHDVYRGEDEVYYRFDTLNHSMLPRLTVQGTGRMVLLVSVDTMWNLFWFVPKDQCDTVNPCGPFGICDINDSPMCSCVHGFQPRSPEDWHLRDRQDGCMRRTAVDCRNGTDGFVRIVGAKLPDTSAAVVDNSADLDTCRERCLRNCSCTAYANAEVDGGGTGCITWPGDLTDIRLYSNTGQDVFVRVAAADLGMVTSIRR